MKVIGRRHIRGGTWLVATILVLLFVAYLGQFGPMDSPVLAGPIDLIISISISIASFLWSVRAGEILAAQAERSRAGAVGS
jgi:hypothetical protein